LFLAQAFESGFGCEIEFLCLDPLPGKRQGITERELQRTKNQFARDYVLGRESNEDKALQLAHAAVIHNDITTADGEFEIFTNVTQADLQRVARTYFTEANRMVLYVLPQAAGGRR